MRPSILTRQRRVHEPFVYAALGFALTAGFGLGAIVVPAMAFGATNGTWWIASVQAHGHAQLFGWIGVFVLGVGLYFLPRLRGTISRASSLNRPALALLSVGVLLHVTCQLLLPAGDVPPASICGMWPVRVGLAISGLAEVLGVALVVIMIVESFRRGRPLTSESPWLKSGRFWLCR